MSAPEPLIVDGLAHAARLHGPRLALIDLATGRRFTYADTLARVGRLAAAWRAATASWRSCAIPPTSTR